MKGICSEPCCEQICFPIFNYLSPETADAVFLTRIDRDYLKGNKYICYPEIFVDFRVPSFDAKKIDEKISTQEFMRIIENLKWKIRHFKILCIIFSIVSILTALAMIIIIINPFQTSRGIGFFFGFLSAITFMSTYLFRDEGVRRARKYLRYLNESKYFAQNLKWKIKNHGEILVLDLEYDLNDESESEISGLKRKKKSDSESLMSPEYNSEDSSDDELHEIHD